MLSFWGSSSAWRSTGWLDSLSWLSCHRSLTGRSRANLAAEFASLFGTLWAEATHEIFKIRSGLLLTGLTCKLRLRVVMSIIRVKYALNILLCTKYVSSSRPKKGGTLSVAAAHEDKMMFKSGIKQSPSRQRLDKRSESITTNLSKPFEEYRAWIKKKCPFNERCYRSFLLITKESRPSQLLLNNSLNGWWSPPRRSKDSSYLV